MSDCYTYCQIIIIYKMKELASPNLIVNKSFYQRISTNGEQSHLDEFSTAAGMQQFYNFDNVTAQKFQTHLVSDTQNTCKLLLGILCTKAEQSSFLIKHHWKEELFKWIALFTKTKLQCANEHANTYVWLALLNTEPWKCPWHWPFIWLYQLCFSFHAIGSVNCN